MKKNPHGSATGSSAASCILKRAAAIRPTSCSLSRLSSASTPISAEDRCISILKERGVDTVVLAGFMRIVKPKLLAAFPNRVLNIHPALLPAFPGVASWKQALDYGCKVAGVTVHFVDAGTDSGPIIVQKAVPVLEDDTPETLHARIQVQEHLAFPEALRLLAAGRLSVEGRRVRIAPGGTRSCASETTT